VTGTELDRAAARAAGLVRARFFDAHGRLLAMPAKRSRQLAVLDAVAQRFVPGVRYTEAEVNRELIGVFDDYVRLRRDLVDAGLLDRADGQYWRCGGTVDLERVGDGAVTDPAGSVTDPAGPITDPVPSNAHAPGHG
jgi:hypothetical protein